MTELKSHAHVPVMLDRTIELLTPAVSRPGAVFVDCTLGLGGHTAAMLEKFSDLRVIGIDRDTNAIGIAKERLKKFGDRVHFYHAVYDELPQVIADAGLNHVDAVLLDLGVSSMQLDDADRGFAYAQDAPLDMRMNQTEGLTAADLVATLSQTELRDIFVKYGDEPLAARYARAIVKERELGEISRSARLVQILQEATPYAKKNERHPAKRVFQALRIAVNDELGALERVLPATLEALNTGGRAVVLAYQSLEDQMVKRVFKDASTSKTPAGLPVEIASLAAKYRLLVRQSEAASVAEQELNARSKPVRLRAIERIGEVQ